MNILLIGADRLGNIPAALRKWGADEIYHWPTLSASRKIPGDVTLVICMTDFLAHNLRDRVREEARKRGVPVVYSRRSLVELREKMGRLMEVGR